MNDTTKTILTVLGAVTGPVSLAWQVWKHLDDRPRFNIAATMVVAFNRGKGTELHIHATATNHGQRRGYVKEFNVEYSSGVPCYRLAFVSGRDQSMPVEAGETISYEMSIPVEYIPMVADKMVLNLTDTKGRKNTRTFPTIGKETLQGEKFTGPKLPPSLVSSLNSPSLKEIVTQQNSTK